LRERAVKTTPSRKPVEVRRQPASNRETHASARRVERDQQMFGLRELVWPKQREKHHGEDARMN
jgi:hypothetical protein